MKEELVSIGSEVVTAAFATLTLGLLIIQSFQQRIARKLSPNVGEKPDPAEILALTKRHEHLESIKLLIAFIVFALVVLGYSLKGIGWSR